jgi:hypothetical protein
MTIEGVVAIGAGIVARKAPRALSKLDMTPSPRVLITRPPPAVTASVTSSTCALRTASIRSSPRLASRAVESTKSLKTTIATPAIGNHPSAWRDFGRLADGKTALRCDLLEGRNHFRIELRAGTCA